jgi:hypothetical protein
MKKLGFYAKDKNNNLHQFEWGADDEFYIVTPMGNIHTNPDDYEVLNIGIITADDFNTPKQTTGYSSVEMFNNVLVHVSRTWERIRMNQINQTMPSDNLCSPDDIVAIATQIFDGKVIQGFVNGSEEVRMNDYWIKNTKEGMSDIFIEAQAEELIRVDILGEKPKPVVRKWEQINDQVELNEDFLPNQDLTYTIFFDGIDRFKAVLEQENFDRKMVGVENAPMTVHYTLKKPMEEFTKEEKELILKYRGLTLEDGFGVDDVFMEKGFLKFEGVDIKINMDVTHRIKFDDGECAEDLLSRTGDIYLHSGGEMGHQDKEDLGGNTKIEFI